MARIYHVPNKIVVDRYVQSSVYHGTIYQYLDKVGHKSKTIEKKSNAIKIDNNPVTGYQILNCWHGNSQDYFMLVHPLGFEFKVKSSDMLYIMQNCTIENSIIKTPLVFGFSSLSSYVLLSPDSNDYKAATKEDTVVSLTMSDIKVGDVVNASSGVYLYTGELHVMDLLKLKSSSKSTKYHSAIYINYSNDTPLNTVDVSRLVKCGRCDTFQSSTIKGVIHHYDLTPEQLDMINDKFKSVTNALPYKYNYTNHICSKDKFSAKDLIIKKEVYSDVQIAANTPISNRSKMSETCIFKLYNTAKGHSYLYDPKNYSHYCFQALTSSADAVFVTDVTKLTPQTGQPIHTSTHHIDTSCSLTKQGYHTVVNFNSAGIIIDGSYVNSISIYTVKFKDKK